MPTSARDTMRAVVLDGYGPVERLRLCGRPRPVPGPEQVVVHVHATTVNPMDWKLRQGRFRLLWPLRLPFVLGFDVAGKVVAVGERVTRWRVGDAVYASLHRGGGYAEYVAISADLVAAKPANLSFTEAAALPSSGLTALQALRDRGGLRAGRRVVVNGASGGVGTCAVQIAVALGADVTAVTSAANLEWVAGLGACRVVDYTRDDFARGPHRYDLIFDAVGSRTFRTCARALSANGVYVTTLPGPGPFAWAAVTRAAGVVGYGKRCRTVMVRSRAADLDLLTTLAEDGRLPPVIDRLYPLAEIRAAHAYAEAGHARGKVVIRVAPDDGPTGPTDGRTTDGRPSGQSC